MNSDRVLIRKIYEVHQHDGLKYKVQPFHVDDAGFSGPYLKWDKLKGEWFKPQSNVAGRFSFAEIKSMKQSRKDCKLLS